MGRPTKFNENTVSDTQNYIENHKDFGDIVPSHVGLARALKVDADTLYEWAKAVDKDGEVVEERTVFAFLLKTLKDEQHRKLISGGLDNEFNPGITKLMMANHGYSERVHQEHSGAVASLTHEQWLDSLEEDE